MLFLLILYWFSFLPHYKIHSNCILNVFHIYTSLNICNVVLCICVFLIYINLFCYSSLTTLKLDIIWFSKCIPYLLGIQNYFIVVLIFTTLNTKKIRYHYILVPYSQRSSPSMNYQFVTFSIFYEIFWFFIFNFWNSLYNQGNFLFLLCFRCHIYFTFDLQKNWADNTGNSHIMPSCLYNFPYYYYY